jgi:hypothetical protein
MRIPALRHWRHLLRRRPRLIRSSVRIAESLAIASWPDLGCERARRRSSATASRPIWPLWAGAIWGRVMGVVSFIVFSKPTCSGSSCQSDCMVARVRGRFSAFRVQFTVLNSPHSWVGASTPGDKTAALAWLSPSEASRRQAARPGVPQRPGVALAPRLRRNDSRQAYGAAPPRRMTPILAAERRRGDGSATSPPRPLGGSVGQMTYR